jgi:peptide/nickel transport system substrate-binding protein
MPKKIDDLMVEFTTTGPNPIELEHLATIYIMSKAWCEKNRATKPQNFAQKEDMITAHQANGTGAYMLKSREPDIKTVLTKNPNWWGIKEGLFTGNADDVIYLPIVSDGTRVAALLSGEVDLVNDPPPQDVPRLKQDSSIKVLEGTENRIVFIGMDQNRDELLYSSVKGKNPFKDKRVREALYQAIDIECISRLPCVALPASGAAVVSGTVDARARTAVALRQNEGQAAAHRRWIRRGLRRHHGLSNNRYVNDEKICQALAAMWAQIGVNVRVNAMPRRTLPKLERPTPVCTCSDGAAAQPTAYSSCSRSSRRTAAKATATITTDATPTRSSTN